MQDEQRRNTAPAKKTDLTAKNVLALIAFVIAFGLATAFLVPGGPPHSMRTLVRSEAKVAHIVQELSTHAAAPENQGGYPPAYGYLRPGAMGKVVEALTDSDHVLEPYTHVIGVHGNEMVYQLPRWTVSFDTNRDGALGLMEYLPVGEQSTPDGTYSFSNTLYNGKNTPRSGGVDEVAAQLEEGRLRPYVYVPFNTKQLAAVGAFWTERYDAFGEGFDRSDPRLASLAFPPEKYDGFVLIGNGPGGNDGGVCSVDPPGEPGVDYNEHYAYHWLGLRVAFLATRDWTTAGTQPDKLLDFDFRDRKAASDLHLLPDGTKSFGAFIKVVL